MSTDMKKTRPTAATVERVNAGAGLDRATTSTQEHTTPPASRQFRIADLLPTGEENAVPLRHLRQLVDLPGREIRKQIQAERMQHKAIFRRLAVLQQVVDRGKPCKVVVTFTDGSNTTTDHGGAIDILRGRGARGEVDSFHTDSPVYSEWAQMMTILLHPTEDRRIEDFE